MVIPKHLAEEVAEECLKMTEYENFVLQKVSEGTLIGLYPMTDDNYLKEFKR
jgi:regulator of RNase E activity RraA